MAQNRRRIIALLAVVLLPALALAHIAVASGPGFANTTQEVTLSVGHGCSGMDTSAVKVVLPSSISTVRSLPGDFGRSTIETDGGLPVAVQWQRPDAELLEVDTNFYKLTLRIKVPNAPFTTVYLPAYQVCKNLVDGGTGSADWVGLPQDVLPDGGGPEPAPALLILPARKPGWNKYTLPVALTNLSTWFGDALIVWKGTDAYSPNPNTAAQISATTGVSTLTSLAAGDEVWVKY